MADWLDEIEAQMDETSPYYLPRLIAEVRRLRFAVPAPPAGERPTSDGKITIDPDAPSLSLDVRSAPTGETALPPNVSIVRREKGGVQIEGHTTQQDWEVEIDEQGNVVATDLPPSGETARERIGEADKGSLAMNLSLIAADSGNGLSAFDRVALNEAAAVLRAQGPEEE